MMEVVEVPKLPPRAAESHKGTFGRVLVVAGSLGMSGAAVLTGTAVMRSGAGLATVACPNSIQSTVTAGFPCYTTHAVAEDRDGRIADATSLLAQSSSFDVLAIGPGLGHGPSITDVVNSLLRVEKPVVLDADGLNAMSPWDSRRAAPTVLTPHPGEFARLTGKPVPADRTEAAGVFAAIFGTVVVLKGHRTVVSDGQRFFINTTGNPGMATGGSGDVLTGIIAGLLAQKLNAFDAAVLGVHMHGRAGDLAAESVGQVSLTAVDILNHLPHAFR